MPWKPGEKVVHDKKANACPKSKRQWAHIADSVLKKTGDEGQAIRTASGVIKNRPACKRNQT